MLSTPLLILSFAVGNAAFLVPQSFAPLHGLPSHCPNNNIIAKLQAAESVIIGKIILDKYGPPTIDDDDGSVTIGGGGPQAAWGAAAALQVREYMSYAAKKETKNIGDATIKDDDLIQSIPDHLITFLAPIGTKNWTPEMTKQLSELLPPMVNIILAPSADHITPTINIWHDEKENVKWMPVDGSFDSVGADGLWQNRPSAQDILRAIETNDCENNIDIIIHAIVESGSKPTGQGLDALPFFDDKLMSRISTVGIEPIVFADDVSGNVTCEDSHAVETKLRRIRQSFSGAQATRDEGTKGDGLFIATPDRPCYEGMVSHTNFKAGQEVDVMENNYIEMIIRDGGNGCFTDEMKMPAATLQTGDKAPLNPTGAGNAFSAAYTVCRGTGSSAEEAASLATAVGAVVCEYEHLPPWSLDVIERMVEAAREVQHKNNILQ